MYTRGAAPLIKILFPSGEELEMGRWDNINNEYSIKSQPLTNY
jgi:hypothetical protein